MSPASPCINLCQMNPDLGLCRGCYRTLDEITRWSRASDADKTAILQAVARRRREAGPIPRPEKAK